MAGGRRQSRPSARREARLPRRRQDAGAARATLLEAAALVFARKGYYGTTVEDIARESGYSPAALYKHFSGLDDLFSHLWTAMAGHLDDIYRRAVTLEAPFEARLTFLLDRLMRLLEAKPEMLVSFMAQRPFISREVRAGHERRAYRHYHQHVRRLTLLMKVGIREGTLRPIDPGDLALLFVGLITEFAHRWITDGRRADTLEGNVRRLIDLFMHGAGRSPLPPARPPRRRGARPLSPGDNR